MKTAVLLHGTGGNNQDYFWFADTKSWLESHGYRVWWPQLPNPDKPTLEAWLSFFEHNSPAFEPGSALTGIINSDNDPWGCTDAAARFVATKLYATQVTMVGHGHMGSVAYHQSYRQFPLIKQLLAQV